jgi:cellulose synthase/poly-beta-1,6-N-acetylglucosamine synthase-like glycosyltransferase
MGGAFSMTRTTSMIQHGISIIVSTNRPQFMNHMLRNYLRQRWTKKELIVIVNKEYVDMRPYQRMARSIANIQVFHLPPSRNTLGRCLNFATNRAKYSYVAKMDDDEYYAPLYLVGMMRAFRRSRADIVGKKAYFIHLSGSQLLLQRFNTPNRFVNIVSGGTIIFKRKVWNQVKFPNRSIGEDVVFCSSCRRAGFKIYSADLYNFCALRRKNPKSHTWQVQDQQFIAHRHSKVIARTNNYRSYVIRSYPE